jgi:thiamine-monophosphate kinase
LVRRARLAIDRHLRPRPQLELGRWLATRRRCVPATIDVSDGLGKDLGRLARASGVGITLDAGALPLPNRGLCAWLGRDPLELTLGGGEDYVLAFTLPGGIEPPAELGCRAIGLTRKGKGVTLTGGDQPPRDVADLGFDHLADALSAQAMSLRRAPP